jgi:hypothetical protein
MKTSVILINALNNLKECANGEITEELFQRNVAELRAILHQLKGQLMAKEHSEQLDDILNYKVISQREPLERFFIRYFGTLAKHTWPVSNWNKKGKYVNDLDNLELKMGGLIYKIEQTERAKNRG